MYNLKLIKCGDRVEIYKYNGYVVNTKGEEITGEVFKDKEDKEELKEKGTQSLKDRKATLNNARNNIIRLIKANPDMQTFITLTFREESNYKESKKLLNNFFTKLRRDYKGLKYIWVLEYGSLKNRLHYHVLTNIKIDIKLSSSKEKKSKEHKEFESNFRTKYWGYGFVDIRQLKEEGNTNIALYVAAYITKDLIDKKLEGYRVYGYSNKTLNKPITTTLYTKESLEELLEAYKDTYKITYTNSYSIGYSKAEKDYKGIVLYMDLIKRED